MKNKKSLFWGLVGLVIIILIGGYIYNKDQERRLADADKAMQESTPGAETKAEGDTAGQPATEEASSTASAEADKPTADGEPNVEETASATEAGSDQPVPEFDVVRVETDGSTIIAGRAQPGTTIEVVSGDTVLAKSEVGPSGDFAAVFENPLAPGDYDIILRVVEEGKIISQSEEVATVSVPKDDPESLLVMVTKPGEASRILTQPEVSDAADVTDRKPDATMAGENTATAASGEKVAAVTDDKMVETPKSGSASQSQSDTDATKTKSAEPAPADTGSTVSEVAKTDEEPEAPAVAGKDAAEVETAQSSSDAATGSDTQMAAVDGKTQPTKSNQDTAVAVGEATNDDTGDAADAKLRIDAVEIENGRVFVAGSATPGASVRVFADGEAIGDSTVSATGRFLVEAQRDIAVGKHTIGADLMMPGSDATTMRVAVPFTRPQGDLVAAVAVPSATESQGSDTGQAETAAEAPDTMEKPSGNVAAGSTAEKQNTMEKSVAETTAADGAAETSDTMEKTADDAAVAKTDDGTVKTAMTDAGTAETGSDSSAMSENETVSTEDKTAMAETNPSTEMTNAKPVEEAAQGDASGASSAAETKVATGESATTEPKTVVQSALEPTGGSVIIRRGDTLWQISRRIYGRGVRYTTIYLANENKISNPDFIEPGQIFMVPDEPLDNAEQLHRDRIKR
jgi:nucleoid-associated protein YgaU